MVMFQKRNFRISHKQFPSNTGTELHQKSWNQDATDEEDTIDKEHAMDKELAMDRFRIVDVAVVG